MLFRRLCEALLMIDYYVRTAKTCIFSTFFIISELTGDIAAPGGASGALDGLFWTHSKPFGTHFDAFMKQI